jgi:hypothetical protein
MFETTTSIVPILVKVEGALAREGALMPEGALEGDQARVREGFRDELLTSRLQEDDPTLSCCFDVLIF